MGLWVDGDPALVDGAGMVEFVVWLPEHPALEDLACTGCGGRAS
jgi:hypothetical protein